MIQSATSLSVVRPIPPTWPNTTWKNTDGRIGYLITGPQSHTSETVGVIKEVLTSPGNLTGRQVQASEQDPRYEANPPSSPPSLLLNPGRWMWLLTRGWGIGRSRIATPTNAPQSRSRISLNIVNFSRPLPFPFNGVCVDSTTSTGLMGWMAPARGDDVPGFLSVAGMGGNDVNVDEEMEMEVRLCVDGCGSLD